MTETDTSQEQQPAETPAEAPAEATVTTFPAETASQHQTMPHNLEAEQALLGALLMDNGIHEKINDGLREKHYHDPLHGRIFAAIQHLCSRGQLANPVTLKSYFVGDKTFEGIDIENYLTQLVDGVLFLSEAPEYAEEIRQCFLRRELIKISDEVTTRARTASLDMTAETQIEEAEQHLFSLAETDQTQRGLIPFKTALEEALKVADDAAKSPGGISGIGTGLNDLNNLLGGLHPSDLVILASRPGMGKTALAANIAFHAATTTLSGEAPQHVAFFALEMSAEQMANRILSGRAGINSNEIRQGRLSPNQFNDLVRAAGEIETAPMYIDDTPSLSVSQVASRARRLKRTQNLGLIVVDYLQLLTAPLGAPVESRLQEISIISRTLKSIAKELNVPVLALSQLSRAVEQREDKRPNLSDLRESGTIEQDADVVMFLYREEYYLSKSEPDRRDTDTDEVFERRYQRWQEKLAKSEGRAEIIIAKQRHGPVGTVAPNFVPEQTRFVDSIAEDHIPEHH